MNGKITMYILEKRIGLIQDNNMCQYYFYPEALPEEIKNKNLKFELVTFDCLNENQAININLKL